MLTGIVTRGLKSSTPFSKNFFSNTIIAVDNLYIYENGRYAPFIEQGDLTGLKTALEKHGDFSVVAVDLLSVAVIERKMDIVGWLLQEGVDPNDPR